MGTKMIVTLQALHLFI